MTDEERIERVAIRMAKHYGVDFSMLKPEPQSDGFQDLECKAFWIELAHEAVDEWRSRSAKDHA